MPAERLDARCVEKPWGRTRLGPGFEHLETGAPIGELWFDAPDHDLLVKYLFTGETLSIQVHPDDDQAQEKGLGRGKDEAWLVLAADPGAVVALGPKVALTPEQLRQSVADREVMNLLHWQAVKPGDFIYSPARTLHTMGAGLTLIEVQQNADVTYRLFDHGRPRELHVEEAVETARLTPFEAQPAPEKPFLLCEGPKFVVEQLLLGSQHVVLQDVEALLIMVEGTGALDGLPVTAGECWRVSDEVDLKLAETGRGLLAYAGARSR